MKTPMEIHIYHDVASMKEMNTIRTQANLKVCIQIVKIIQIGHCCQLSLLRIAYFLHFLFYLKLIRAGMFKGKGSKTCIKDCDDFVSTLIKRC